MPMANFNVQSFVDVALQLVEHDETERALLLLNNLPAKYRDHEPPEVTKLRSDIMARIFTVQDYAENDSDDLKPNDQNLRFLNTTARGNSLKTLLEAANKNDIIPHIIDYGPGDFGLPLACSDIGLKFGYTPIGLHSKAQDQAKEKLTSKWIENYKTSISPVKWFVAFEIIEHLHNPDEIRQVFDKIQGHVDKVLFSTPKYTYGTGNPTWRDRGCPHLRAYTPNEFALWCQTKFPGYKWEFTDNEVMCMIGSRV